ncbi:AAA family ATPase [Halomonas nitroreducens]|uniref:Nuclease SbcCD subunit C n=1 Tax=Halomonas nitroreducens TaxID=447425 RepID=A0A3S0JVU0_9GAMM|nr:AAA family ATPase [Halomonas nitroreducens]RTR02880.1 chromosome segregation protein SMC [Halomonas nitroreducens]
MRILALRLANLASLPGPVELDFGKAPLADAGLFAITGPTGAGKSTLLDALCLALYGSTPRLRQAPVRDAQLPDVGRETLTTADPRTLLRRGTASGHAEVDFLGRDGRRYRARWAVRRAREKAGGRLQAVEQSLTDLEDERLLTTQKREFDRLLPERLGLSFDQFTRAVLLAQSEFAAFLKADDNERSELLEKLTDTAEYSEISKAAYRRAREAQRRLEVLEARLADDPPAEPEARAELERAAETTQRALTDLQKRAESLQAEQRWHDDDTRLADAFRQGQGELQSAEAEWRSLAPLRTDREWRRLIAPRRHDLTRQAELPDEISALEATHAEILKARDNAHAERQAAGQALVQADQALNEATETRRRADPELREARELAQRLATQERQLADLEASHHQLQKQATTLAGEHRQADEAQRARQQQRDDWQKTQRRLLGPHRHLDDARRAAQQLHDQAAQRRLALGELSSHWQEVCHAAQARDRLTNQVSEERSRRERLLAEGQAARERLDRAQAHLDSVSALVERGRAVRSESVARLREALTDGEPCPVCGGLDHPWRHQPPASPEATQLAAQEAEEARQLSEARATRDTAQRQRDELVGDYRGVERSLKPLERDLETTEQRLGAAQQALEAHPLHDELAAVDTAERNAWLQAQREQSEGQRQQQRQALEALTQAEEALAPLEESLRQGELALTRLEAEKASADRRLAEVDEQLPAHRQRRDGLARELAARLGEHASPDAWQQHLDTRQERARQAWDAAQARDHEAQQRHQRLTQQLEQETHQLDQRRQERQDLEHELTTWRRGHPELDDATLARLLDQSEEDAEEAERRIEAASQACQRTAATLGERRDALWRHRRDRGLVEGDTGDEETLLSDAIADELHRRREALSEAQVELGPRLAAAQRDRDEAVHALKDDDRRRERQRQGQAEREAAQAEQRRWGRISELIGAADGKAFRRIAQAWNLERLLEEANAHLTGLTRRYRLERGGSELGLLVVDRDMGDERRSVHSLSGGETFLVSLALALGLASMASGQLAIESLFIDEGFGSLDPQSLALAMEALDGLQAQGRRVGVISHVQEMHERIPVQIRVEPLGNGTSRARLVSG